MLFNRVSIVKLLSKFNDRSLTCTKAMEQVIERSQQTKDMNHFTFQDFPAMLEAAVSSDKAYKQGTNRILEGIPIAIKANIDTTDSPTDAASPAFKGHIPKVNCTLWEKLRMAGMINCGKTNMHEFAYGTTTANGYYGAAQSAFDKTRSAGGSSGGTGGCVGTGCAPIGLGTDTGGSIRIPATSNGVIGYKPTINRWPADYGIKMSHLRDTVGPLAVSMDDVAFLDEVVTNERHNTTLLPSQIRIGVPHQNYYEDLDPEVQRVAERTLKKLKDAGITLVRNEGIKGLAEINSKASFDVVNYELPNRLQDYIVRNNLNLSLEQIYSKLASEDVKQLFQGVLENPITEEQFYQAYHVHRVTLNRAFQQYFDQSGVDAIIYPTMPMLPCKLEEFTSPNFEVTHNGRKVSQISKSIQNTDPASNTNSPCISLPAKRIDEGIPVNMELCSLSGQDTKLIAISKSVERIIGK